VAPDYVTLVFIKKQKLPDIYLSHKIEAKHSDVHGVGVFAVEDIRSREVIERCHLICCAPETFQILEDACGYPHILETYVFADVDVALEISRCFPTGFATLYNHAPQDDRNAIFRFETNEKTKYRYLEFITTRPISAGEEIFTCYNPEIAEFNDLGITIGHGQIELQDSSRGIAGIDQNQGVNDWMLKGSHDPGKSKITDE